MTVLDLIAVGPNLVTACIVVVMIVLFYRAWISEKRTIWASYLVQLGIFGTFLGIAIGLFGLDVGGDAGEQTQLARILGPAFPEQDTAQAIQRLVQCYKQSRLPQESFIQTFNRIGIEPFKTAAYPGTAA